MDREAPASSLEVHGRGAERAVLRSPESGTSRSRDDQQAPLSTSGSTQKISST